MKSSTKSYQKGSSESIESSKSSKTSTSNDSRQPSLIDVGYTPSGHRYGTMRLNDEPHGRKKHEQQKRDITSNSKINVSSVNSNSKNDSNSDLEEDMSKASSSIYKGKMSRSSLRGSGSSRGSTPDGSKRRISNNALDNSKTGKREVNSNESLATTHSKFSSFSNRHRKSSTSSSIKNVKSVPSTTASSISSNSTSTENLNSDDEQVLQGPFSNINIETEDDVTNSQTSSTASIDVDLCKGDSVVDINDETDKESDDEIDDKEDDMNDRCLENLTNNNSHRDNNNSSNNSSSKSNNIDQPPPLLSPSLSRSSDGVISPDNCNNNNASLLAADPPLPSDLYDTSSNEDPFEIDTIEEDSNVTQFKSTESPPITRVKTRHTRGLFDDSNSDDGEDLFSAQKYPSKASPSINSPTRNVIKSKSPPNIESVRAPKEESILDVAQNKNVSKSTNHSTQVCEPENLVNPDSNVFSSTNKVKPSRVTINLFEDDVSDSDDDLFATSSTIKSEQIVKKPERSNIVCHEQVNKDSIIDSVDNAYLDKEKNSVDEVSKTLPSTKDNLFPNQTIPSQNDNGRNIFSPSSRKSDKSSIKVKSIFDDDEELFSTKKELFQENKKGFAK